jgi:hypothetical protein
MVTTPLRFFSGAGMIMPVSWPSLLYVSNKCLLHQTFGDICDLLHGFLPRRKCIEGRQRQIPMPAEITRQIALDGKVLKTQIVLGDIVMKHPVFIALLN